MALTPPLQFYNTLTRKLETFTPLQPDQVSLYSCGPTVYNYIHLGNLRSFLLSDLLRRTLVANGYTVKQVMNITDVDDKTIRASRHEGLSLHDLTKRYEEFFLADLAACQIQRPTYLPRASEHLPEMITLIEKLLATGLAYPASDGVYFAVTKFKAYGQLAKIKLGQITKERIKNDEYDKEQAHDFALWKFHTPDDGEVFWDAPFGRGRPGWHIECSAMSTKYLGDHFDFHTGGTDLIFPHHENELAQSSVVAGVKPVARYWLHNGFVNINSDKMSKSLGNTLRLDDLVQAGITPLAYRYWLLTAHYRTTVNFTLDSGKQAETAYRKLLDQFLAWPELGGQVNEQYWGQFLNALNHDLNTPMALALVWSLVKDVGVSPADRRATLLAFDRVLGLGLETAKPAAIPPELVSLANERDRARQAQNWALADQLRAQIEAAGYLIEDSDQGSKIRLK